MFVYNSQITGNPFGFADKRTSSTGMLNIRKRTVVRSTSHPKKAKKCSQIKKLTAKNVKFLKLLGLKVKRK